MIQKLIDQVPLPIRWSTDGAIVATGIAHFMGWWKDNIGTLAATAGLLWVLIQAYYFLKEKRKGKK